jgi:hypothetical protein
MCTNSFELAWFLDTQFSFEFFIFKNFSIKIIGNKKLKMYQIKFIKIANKPSHHAMPFGRCRLDGTKEGQQ